MVMPSFGQKEYEEYARLMKVAENIYNYHGDGPEYEQAQNEADSAYERYEYAAGLKIADDY